MKATTPNNFSCSPKHASDHFRPPRMTLLGDPNRMMANDRGKLPMPPTLVGRACVADTRRDLLKIAVVNRYADAPIALG